MVQLAVVYLQGGRWEDGIWVSQGHWNEGQTCCMTTYPGPHRLVQKQMRIVILFYELYETRSHWVAQVSL